MCRKFNNSFEIYEPQDCPYMVNLWPSSEPDSPALLVQAQMKSNNVGHNLGQTVWGFMDTIYLKHKCKAGFLGIC